MNNGNTIKSSKLQTLNASLEAARARLAAAEARLRPLIDAEQARVDQLQAAYEKADKASTKAYEAYQTEQRATEARLFPKEKVEALREAIQAHVGAKFPQASVNRLANEYMGAKLNADPVLTAARAAHAAAHANEEKARRVYWQATSPSSTISNLQRELETHRDSVRELEKEIERLPRYRQAAKDRRAEERQEKIVDEQTEAARAMMADFRFE